MSVITGNGATYPTSFEGPDDGDPRAADAMNAALEALADRTENLRGRLEGALGFVEVHNLEVTNDALIHDALDVLGHTTLNTMSAAQYSVQQRTVVDVQHGTPVAESGWDTEVVGGSLTWMWVTNSTSASDLIIPIDVPDGVNITSVSARITGAITHSSLPENMPTLTVYRQRLFSSGAASQSWSAEDDSASFIQYVSGHDITVEFDPPHTVDRSTGKYFAVLTSESGANALAGARFFGLIVTYTYTRIDRAAS